MRKKVILITGANGEVGHGLINYLSALEDAQPILALDVRELDAHIKPLVDTVIIGDILDAQLLDRLMTEYEIDTIYHMAALLSTRAEFNPALAHRVNVQGTANLLQVAIEQARWRGHNVKFLFASSVAAHGIRDLATKNSAPPISEDEYTLPTTMYGCNKLYCEHLGRYYARHYRQLAQTTELFGVDFRCVRFPGLISATTMPSGGTSDYGPEMIHAAAKGEPYECFVRPDTTMPFMVMPDAIKSLLMLTEASHESLTRTVYNVTSFSISAEQIAARVRHVFPNAQVTYKPDDGRQAIVDSWPAAVSDEAARRDWGWSPDFGVDEAFDNYLLPTIRQKYQSS